MPYYWSQNMGSLQFHSYIYDGPLECKPCIDATPTAEPTLSPTPSPPPTTTMVATPSPTSTGCDCPTGDPRIESWKCGQDCFACPGRTSLPSDQVCRMNGCTYSLTQAECDTFKTLNLQDKCPGGDERGLSHFVCYDPTGAFKTESGGCGECEHFEDYTWTR